jgi:hypothetical protein
MHRRMLPTILIVGTVIAALPTPARAATRSDPDDVGPRLDIRSVSVAQVHHRTRVTLVFWDRTPVSLLRRRVARLEMSTRAPSRASAGYGFRFWPNSRGRLRITYGDPGSGCCGHDRAEHPDPFTYTALIDFSLDNPYPPESDRIKTFRGATTRRVHCGLSRRCGLSGGRSIDRTPWTRV